MSRRTGYEQAARERVRNSSRLAEHEETLFYDWPNWDEHLRWVATADEKEILDWIRTVEQAD